MKKLIIASFILSSFNASAWGPIGHRAVGEVAQRLLEVPVLTKVSALSDYQSLAKISTWPDDIKSEPEKYGHTFNWHFTDWPDGNHDHDETHSEGKLLGAIEEQVKVLRNNLAPKEKRAEALKFIVHFVGDLHQPMHVGNGLDRGGNNCKVLFHNKQTNLHSLWDEGMIGFTGLSFTELSRFSIEGKSVNDYVNARAGTVLDWARESKLIRATIYPANVKNKDELISVRDYCRTDGPVSSDEMPRLGYEYSYKFMPVIEDRIFKAGVRLAKVLNDALR